MTDAPPGIKAGRLECRSFRDISGDRGRGDSIRDPESAEIRPPVRDFERSAAVGRGGTGGGGIRLVGEARAAARRAGIDVLAPRARFRIESACVEWNCEKFATEGFFCSDFSLNWSDNRALAGRWVYCRCGIFGEGSGGVGLGPGTGVVEGRGIFEGLANVTDTATFRCGLAGVDS